MAPSRLDTGWQQWEQAAAGGPRDSTDMSDMQQLDPSPIESPEEERMEVEEVKGEYFAPPPKTSSRSLTGRLGLSGGGHGAVYYLTRLQKYSSYTFLIYTTFHITNTSIIPLITRSLPTADTYLLLTRPYYQSFPLEPLLITAPLITHVLSGFALRLHRRSQNLVRYGASSLAPNLRIHNHVRVWPRLSWTSASGYILVPLVTGHAFINRVLPLIVDGGSSSINLHFVAHGVAKTPVLATTAYVALVTAFSGHIVWGLARYWGLAPLGDSSGDVQGRSGKAANTTAKRRWWSLHAVSVLVASLWLAGGMGVVGRAGKAEGWIAKLWDVIYARVPLLGL